MKRLYKTIWPLIFRGILIQISQKFLQLSKIFKFVRGDKILHGIPVITNICSNMRSKDWQVAPYFA